MRLTLYVYLFVCLGTITLVPTVIMGVARMHRSQESQIERSDRENTLAADGLAREAAQLMKAHTDAVEGLSRQVEITGALDPAVLQPIVTAQHTAAEQLGNMWVANAMGLSLAADPATDAAGKPTAGTDYSDRDYYKNVVRTNTTAYSRAQLGRTTHRPNLQIVEPIRDREGKFIGLSEGAVDLAEIQTLAEAVVESANGLQIVVLDSEGRVLAHPDPAARDSMRDLSAIALYQHPAGRSSELRVGSDEQGVAMRVAAAPVPLGGLNWTVVVGRTQASLDIAIARTQNQTLVIGSLSLAAGLAVAAALATLLARPIVRLSSVASAVGRGDLATASPAPRAGLPYEVNVLLGAVGDMIAQLRVRTTELEHLAMHDPLTTLPNRALLRDRLEQALLASGRDGRPMALLLMDLDRFKDVNDTFGHPAGDRLLQEVGQRLRTAVRESDTIARLGGDEFAVVLPGTDAQGAERVARGLVAALTQPFIVEGQPIEVGVSIGISLSPEHATDAADLQRQADVAMYAAKRGELGFAVYALDLDRNSPDRLGLVADLRRAIAGNELVLYYQPLVDVESGRATAFEALVRWRHPQRGLVPPDDFVPLAEQTGLIRPLSMWVLDHALQQCREWREAGNEVTVAVNLSMRNLQDAELPGVLDRLLARWQVAPSQLRIEVTESSLMADPGAAMGVLTHLRELGVGVAIDDFGTGYSSLAYLKRLPVDELKIDKSFVKDMVTDPEDAAIVRSTIGLAHELGLKVVAEGVEDQATWDLLARQNCDTIQGYYVSRPLPAAQAARWMRERRAPLSAAA